MEKIKREREVVDAIWADPFKSGDPGRRVEAIRRGDLEALIALSIRIID
ncbi:MAG: hypothetical protein ABSC51_08340 [Gaiellaceae bacterium]|jgi:hypothetical protein